MDAAILSALAAMGGSTVGALTPLMNNYLMQRSLVQREFFNHQLAQRESLYSDFILTASRLYANSLSHSLESLDDVVGLYAMLSRIRLVASHPVLTAAEDLVRQIVRHYGDPNLDLDHIREALLSNTSDPLRQFSIACRKELAESAQSGQIAGVSNRRTRAHS